MARAALDSPQSSPLERLAALAASALDASAVMVEAVEGEAVSVERRAGAAAVVGQAPRIQTLCQAVRDTARPVAVEEVHAPSSDARQVGQGDFHPIAYLGVPLLDSGGRAIGSICVIDHGPRRWSQGDLETLTAFAGAMTANLELRWQTQLAADAARARDLAERRLRVERAVTLALTETDNLRGSLRRMLVAVREAYGWAWSAVWTVDRASDALRCREVGAAADFKAPPLDSLSRATPLARGQGLPGRVWASGQPAWISDVQEDDNFIRRAAARDAGLHGAFCFPIAWGGQVVGVMEFYTRDVQPPDEPLLALLESVGRQVGQALERKRAEVGLRRSEARLAAVVHTSLDCIVGMDHAGQVVEWNPAAERVFGYSRAEAIGREMAELIIPPALRPAHRAGLARYLTTGDAVVLEQRLELSALRRNGEEFPVELTITRVSAEGAPAFTGYLRDITAQKQAERDREVLLAGERAARTEAERASRLKDEFLATVSHELRTPLNAILGYAQLLRHNPVPPEVAEGLEVIERNARMQAELVGDILDMSRIVSGKLRLDVQRVDLPQVIGAAMETVRPAADAKGIRLVRTIDPAAGPVSGDPSRLQQVIWNLLANAVKFTPKLGRVQVVLGRVNSHVEIAVSDTGQGIPLAFLPHVWDKFRQSDSSAARRHGGLGLGLALVKNLVEMHGGSVRASSPGEGMGATFVVELPLTALHTDPLDAARRHPTTATSTSTGAAAAIDLPCLSGVTVLAVDDERDSRELVRRLLEECGARVVVAGSARDALESLEREPVDVLLSDIGMPDVDGYELIRRVRARPAEQGGDVPAMALTAFARSEDRTRALVAGFQSHIAKPVEPTELTAAVASLARGVGRSAR